MVIVPAIYGIFKVTNMRPFSKVILLLVLFNCFCTTTNATLIISRCDGYWNDTTVWQGGIVPVSGDSIIIDHYIRLNASTTITEYLCVNSGAELCGSVSFTVAGGGYVVNNGIVKLGSLNVAGYFVNNGTANIGGLSVSGSYVNNGGSVIGGTWSCTPFAYACYPPVAQFGISDTIICAGECINFINTSYSGPNNYTWWFAGASTPTSTSINPTNICYPAPGTYDVVLVADNTMGNDTSYQTIYVLGNSTATIDTSINCDNYTSPSGNYSWGLSGTYFDTIPNYLGCDSILTINLSTMNTYGLVVDTGCNEYLYPPGGLAFYVTGTYYDTLTNNALCDSIIIFQITIINCDGIPNTEIEHVKIYPNPFSDIIRIESDQGLLNKEVIIQNLLGQEMKHEIIDHPNSYHILDMSNLPPGTYILIYNNRRFKIVKS